MKEAILNDFRNKKTIFTKLLTKTKKMKNLFYALFFVLFACTSPNTTPDMTLYNANLEIVKVMGSEAGHSPSGIE